MISADVIHKSNELLKHDLSQLIAGGCRNTALVVAHIAEADRRKLYLSEGYPSMYAYCVDALHLSEAAAYKRIHAGRASRKCPQILMALADGRVHLSAVCMIAPYLTRRTGSELLDAVTHRRRFEIIEMLARRFPQPDRLAVDTEVRPLPATALPPQTKPLGELDPGAVGIATGMGPASPLLADAPLLAPGELAPGAVAAVLAAVAASASGSRSEARRDPSEATPLAADRFEVRFVIDRETHDLLQRAQDLLGHSVPSGSIPELFRRSLLALISQTEKKKAAVGGRPRQSTGTPRRVASTRNRYIPASVRRAVWERDGGRCTFVSDTGQRCESRKFLEFDHADPVARGGKPTVDRVRLRCRGHNQYEAERAFGVEFMERKRIEARREKSPAMKSDPAARSG